ncbi:MAG: hypothetical protein V4736_00015, partial [Bdellovibrionota bacterium]
AFRFTISAHNAQPFFFQLEGDIVHVWIYYKRLLPIADPHHKDLLMGLGCLVESIQIMCSEIGLRPVPVGEPNVNKLTEPWHLILTLQLEKQVPVKTEMAGLLEKRFSYRGLFEEVSLSPMDTEKIGRDAILNFINSPEDLKEISRTFDKVNLRFMVKRGYMKELYSWMRFSRKHPKWNTDGLNAEAMSLKSYEAFFGRLMMQPKWFHTLYRLGIAGIVVSEADKIKTSSGLAVIHAKTNNYYEQGRIFLRAWLLLTKRNLYGAPLSLLTDSEDGIKAINNLVDPEGHSYLVNVLRVGPLPVGYRRYQPARLSDFRKKAL